MAKLMSSGVFEPPTTAEQQAALDRLEHLLALVEGWVDDVTSEAAGTRLPAAGALRETMSRRRASGGPAEHTFETLVGLNLRPRHLREASALWRAVAEHRSMAERDDLWSHPDLLPDAAALDDPTGFATKAASSDWDISTLTDTEPPDEQAPQQE
jgi:putative hydrolase